MLPSHIPDRPSLLTSSFQSIPKDDSWQLDTTAWDILVNNKDMQGIPWQNTEYTRSSYRVFRDTYYNSYYNLEEQVTQAKPAIDKEALEISPPFASPHSKPYYSFNRNWRSVHSTIKHFQLRNLLWAMSSNELLYVDENKVEHWNSATKGAGITTLMDVSGVLPNATASNGVGVVQVCTLCAKEGVIAAGGFAGELLVQRLPDASSLLEDDNNNSSSSEMDGTRSRFEFSRSITDNENGITNAIDIFKTSSGATTIACSNNDAMVRMFDAETFQSVGTLDPSWAVNYSIAQPCCSNNNSSGGGRAICVVGDDTEGYIYDLSSGKKVLSLKGHYDYSFAAAWHPDGNIIATGNQDKTTRLYDLRKPSQSFALLKAHIGAVRSLRFSPDGAFLAVAEPADYVTLYDVASEYKRAQTIDLFGEVSGVSFSPDDGGRLYVAVADITYSSAIQFDRQRGGGEGGGGDDDCDALFGRTII